MRGFGSKWVKAPGFALRIGLIGVVLRRIFCTYSKRIECANITRLSSAAFTSSTSVVGRDLAAPFSHRSGPQRLWKGRVRLWGYLLAAAAPFAAWGSLSANPTLAPVAIL